MKITVFGATGGVGRQILDQALGLGHEVTAFARNPNKLTRSHANLSVEQGDVLDEAAVRRAVKGADAVVIALGMPLFNKDGLRAKGTRTIVSAMCDTGVKRLICLSSLGTGESREGLPWHYRYIIFPLFMRHVLADHGLQETHVKNSDLDWTIVRPGNFSDGALTGKYRHGFTARDKMPRLKISRADVADFMLKQLTSDTYLHKAAGLSY